VSQTNEPRQHEEQQNINEHEHDITKHKCKIPECQNLTQRTYCSIDCYALSKSVNPHKCANPECDNVILRSRKKYCSIQCYRVISKSKSAFDTCILEGCGKKLTQRKSDRKFCCHEHYILHKLTLPKKKEPKICALPSCNNVVKRRGKQVKFCSTKCYQISMTKLEKHMCPECGEEFQPSRKNKKYCSIECQKKPKGFIFKEIHGKIHRFSLIKGKHIPTSMVTWNQNNPDNQINFVNTFVWFKDGEQLNDKSVDNLFLVSKDDFIKFSLKTDDNSYRTRTDNPNDKTTYFNPHQELF
jgi:hypothetical protein